MYGTDHHAGRGAASRPGSGGPAPAQPPGNHEEARLSQQLSALRLEGKTKTARFRELLGQKLILSAMTGRLRGCGALPMKEPAENSCNDLNGL